MEHLNSEFIRICKDSSDFEVQRLPKNIDETLSYLSSLPNKTNFKFSDPNYFKEIFTQDVYKGMKLYWKEIDERIKLLWQTMGLKGFHLLNGIVKCINTRNYYSASILVRALLENAAVFHYYLWKIIPTYNDFRSDTILKKKITNREVMGVIVSRELENLLIKYSHGTKMKDIVKVKKEWEQERISTFMNFLSKNKKYKNAYKFYSILCEIAHPNFGSILAFYDHGAGTNIYTEVSFSKSQNVQFFLNTSAYPINISCEILKEGINSIRDISFYKILFG